MLFKTMFDKLTQAYIHDQVRPLDACACFIGNMLGGVNSWLVDAHHLQNGGSFRNGHLQQAINTYAEGYYTPLELALLEKLFMHTLSEKRGSWVQQDPQEREESLFEAFTAALDRLRQIHEEKGERVDGYLFEKRKLQEAYNGK